MDCYLPRTGDQNLALLHICGTEIHQNIDHEKKVYDEIGVQ